MHTVLSALSALTLALALPLVSGCSLSVGAGAEGSLGRRARAIDPRCDGFESCERVHRAARESAEHCHQTSADCDTEDHDAALSYVVLVEQTRQELRALQSMAREERQQADSARAEERNACSERVNALQARCGGADRDGWFDAPPSAPAR